MERLRVTTFAVAAVLAIVAAAVVVLDAGRSPAATKADRQSSADGGAPTRPGEGAKGESPVATGAAAGRLLSPDMFSLRAQDLRLDVRAGQRVLRFAALLANKGPGPMVVRPLAQRRCASGQRHARQLMYVDRNRDGLFQRRRDTHVRSRSAGCMLDHPTHDHWHLDAMAAYRLVDPEPRPRVIVGRAKVSFCLRDNRPVPGTRPRQRRQYFGECDRHRVQGISPGWVDVYDNETPGQSLRLPRGMRNGLYCLVLRADPRDQLEETDETNNARALPIRIRGTKVSIARVRTCRALVG